MAEVDLVWSSPSSAKCPERAETFPRHACPRPCLPGSVASSAWAQFCSSLGLQPSGPCSPSCQPCKPPPDLGGESVMCGLAEQGPGAGVGCSRAPRRGQGEDSKLQRALILRRLSPDAWPCPRPPASAWQAVEGWPRPSCCQPPAHLAELFSASFSNIYVHINPLGGFIKMSVLSQAPWDGACGSAFPRSSQSCRCCWPTEHPY